MSTNPLLPAVPVTVDGIKYTLRFDFESIAEAEEIVDRALITGLRPQDIRAPRIRLVQAMFFASAHFDQPTLTFDAAKKLITRDTLLEVWPKVLEAWTASNDEPEPIENEDAPVDPIPAQS
jgi:hypothetical protein